MWSYTDGLFSEGQLQRIDNMEEIYRKSKVRDNVLDRLCIEARKHHTAKLEFQRITKNIEEEIEQPEEEIKNYQILLTILHPCFSSIALELVHKPK